MWVYMDECVNRFVCFWHNVSFSFWLWGNSLFYLVCKYTASFLCPALGSNVHSSPSCVYIFAYGHSDSFSFCAQRVYTWISKARVVLFCLSRVARLVFVGVSYKNMLVLFSCRFLLLLCGSSSSAVSVLVNAVCHCVGVCLVCGLLGFYCWYICVDW